jgi:hypothetical protein
MFLSAVVPAIIVMMRSLAVMMGSRFMMGCSAMVVFARSMLFFGSVHCISPKAPGHKILSGSSFQTALKALSAEATRQRQ